MKINFLLLFLSMASLSFAQKDLPIYSAQAIKSTDDWMVSAGKMNAALYRTNDGHLVLSNGIVSRTFTLKPNVVTIGLDQIRKDISFLRSVRPEASVEIDGMYFNVGGLTGQPIHNYLLKEWIPQLKNDPMSFQFVKYELRETKERFPWMKKRDWMPKDLPWPAPGKELIFTYKLKQEALDLMVKENMSDKKRPVLFDDDFKTLKPEWELFQSKAHQRNSFTNEGKVGEIMSVGNSAVYAEQGFNKDARVVVAKVSYGTDQASSWGPGLSLVFPNQTVKINIQSNEKCIGFYNGETERKSISIGEVQSVWLRMELLDKSVEASISTDGINWNSVGSARRKDDSLPSKIRIGKMDAKGGFSDGRKSENESRCRINHLSQLGKLSEISSSNLLSQLNYLKEIEVNVHYELYDNLPVFSKWITVTNNSGKTITINSFKSEILAAAEPESSVDERSSWLYPNITLESDYNFGGMSEDYLYSSSIAWKADPAYSTQVNYERKTPCLLEASPKVGPQQAVSPGGSFASFRIWELLNDSWDRERKSLAYRKMMRSIAPWITENPILMHVRSSDNESVKKAIDQCAEVGFEMVIMTFWSGFEAEDDSPENLRRMTELANYAKSKGVALGGYSLLASRSIDKQNDVVLPDGQIPRFGNSPCIESKWGQEYFRKLYQLYDKTGLNVFEHDGSYPGDLCSSSNHPGHKDINDSQWNQFRRVTDFYKWCRSKGIYLNVPDVYFLNGSNKIGMGYREANWSLPREQQEIVERQNIYDGTWNKTPSMGWMFVPLVEYQGGGKAATIEPLKDHLPHYGQRLANLFGAGVQACYRGPQLYDSPQTKSLVQKWVDFYKSHREVLDADIIHIRRPDGADYDAILHVNPSGKEKGLLMVYNPLSKDIHRQIKVNLYYTGLKDKVSVKDLDEFVRKYTIDRDYCVELDMLIPAQSQLSFIFE
ncbi:MAG TPA: hypothetical protein PKA78_00885 [Macellibacteroides fermentans]|uniref:hypothetical protein n=1 Tax=Macellibacteroides fermentans TaxID=879969 RepID=UPI002B686282|nr:hypothetical protein [Macellibacteroides fermentans]